MKRRPNIFIEAAELVDESTSLAPFSALVCHEANSAEIDLLTDVIFGAPNRLAPVNEAHLKEAGVLTLLFCAEIAKDGEDFE